MRFLRAFLIVFVCAVGLVFVFAAFGPLFMMGWD